MNQSSSPSSNARLTIFVYGTLKRGGSNHSLIALQQFLGEARTLPGYQLYELDGYPGLVVERANRSDVTGEVWNVDAVCLAELDQLEGTAEGLYRRTTVALAPPYEKTHVEAYFYAQSISGRQPHGPTWQV